MVHAMNIKITPEFHCLLYTSHYANECNATKTVITEILKNLVAALQYSVKIRKFRMRKLCTVSRRSFMF